MGFRRRDEVFSRETGDSRPIQGIPHAGGGHHWMDPFASAVAFVASVVVGGCYRVLEVVQLSSMRHVRVSVVLNGLVPELIIVHAIGLVAHHLILSRHCVAPYASKHVLLGFLPHSRLCLQEIVNTF